jgi:chitodextrinase
VTRIKRGQAGRHKIATTRRGRWLRPLLVVALVTLGAQAVSARASSAAPSLSFLAAQGQLTTPATIVADGAGGQAVQFNPPVPDSAGFVHPGILVDQSQLSFVQNEIATGAAPWTGALAAVNPFYSAPTYAARPVATVDCGANAQGCSLVINDAIAAYTQALLYSYSTAPDRAKYADDAIRIMNAWSSTVKSSNGNQSRLYLAWAAEVFPRAAEIIRYTFTPGPSDPVFDVAAFTNMLNTVFEPSIIAGDPFSNGNWELSMADGLMNIGVFTDNRTVFNAGVAMWRARVPAYIYLSTDNNGSGQPVAPPGGKYSDPATLRCFWLGIGTNANTCKVPTGFTYYDGMTQETCRDLSHPVIGLDAMMNGAETARLQGVDLYGEQKQRITDAYEYTAAFDNQYLTSRVWPTTPCGGQPGSYSGQGGDGTGGTSYLYGWEIGYNEFANRLGMAMPNTQAMIARVRPTNGVNASDWETLTSAGPPLPAGCAAPDARSGSDLITANVPTDGVYRLWSRVEPTNSANTSLALQTDGGCAVHIGGANLPTGQWTWIDYQNGDSTSKVNLTLTAGTHTLLLTGISAGLSIDSFSLVADPTCVPIDTGANCVPTDPTIDTTPPTTDLTAPLDSTTVAGQVPLAADAADDTAVTRVDFLVGTTVVGSATTAPYTASWDTTTSPDGPYTVESRAYDAAGNSTTSDPVSVTVLNADSQPPSAPTNLLATPTSATSVGLSWTAATDNLSVVGYTIERGGTQVGTTTATTFSDAGLTALTSYSYTVTAADGAGNVGPPSDPSTVTTLDGTPPTAPTGVVATVNTDNSVAVSWSAASDDVGVTGYLVLRNGVQVGTTSGALSFTDATAAAKTNYAYTVEAVDAASNTSAASAPPAIVTTAPSPDTTPPTVPANVVATPVNATSTSLTWAASTDDVGVVRYLIFRGGVQVGTSTSLTYPDAGLSPSTSYSYTVSAQDAAGNTSAASVAALVTTPALPDTTPPTVPTNVAAVATGATAVTVSWAAASDDVGVVRYLVFRAGVQVGTSTSLSYPDTGLAPSTSYTYAVFAQDAAGNTSPTSATATITTPALADTTKPTVPTNLKVTATNATSTALTWTASTDNVGVTRYLVFRGGVQIGTSATATYADSGLTAKTSYSYTVAAQDAASNTSSASSAASVTTPAAADTTPPTAPGTLTATVASFNQIALTWTAATDNVGVTAYRLSRGGVQINQSSALTFTDSNLTAATSYTYSVVALDAAGNSSAAKTVTISTPLAAAPSGAGWAGAYFANATLSGSPIGRLDATVNFSWGSAAPMAGIPVDHFSVRWTGQLTPATSGTYTFYTQTDDGARLYVNDTLLINGWAGGPSNRSATMALTKGTAYNVRMEYYDVTGTATAQLLWSGPSVTKAAIPASVMKSSSAGLIASFFTTTNLVGTPSVVRLDNTVNNTWGTGSPDSRIPSDNFSARWSGKITPPTTGTYTFYTDSIGGVRLTINGQLIINNWTLHALTTNTGTIALTAGTSYTILLEYQVGTGSAEAKLSWSNGSFGKTVVPQSALRDR